jgi:hypothetical protein
VTFTVIGRLIVERELAMGPVEVHAGLVPAAAVVERQPQKSLVRGNAAARPASFLRNSK